MEPLKEGTTWELRDSRKLERSPIRQQMYALLPSGNSKAIEVATKRTPWTNDGVLC